MLLVSIIFLSGCAETDTKNIRTQSTIEEDNLVLKPKKIYCDKNNLAYYAIDFSDNSKNVPIYNKNKQHMTCEEHKTLMSKEKSFFVK